jgi:hypothetical protein
LELAPKGEREFVEDVYRFRVMINIDKLFVAKGDEPRVEIESLPHFRGAISFSGRLLERGQNALRNKRDPKDTSSSEFLKRCHELSEDWIKRLYLQQLAEINNYVDVLGKYPEIVRALDVEPELRNFAGDLVALEHDKDCLHTLDKQEHDNMTASIPDGYRSTLSISETDAEAYFAVSMIPAPWPLGDWPKSKELTN